MKKLSISFLLIFIATVSYAEPVYLECILGKDYDGKDLIAKMTIDESNGRVTHTDWTGDVKIYKGFFSANEVKYEDIDIADALKIKTTERWVINRQDLSYTRTNIMESPGTEPLTTIRKGQCEIITVKDRKF